MPIQATTRISRTEKTGSDRGCIWDQKIQKMCGLLVFTCHQQLWEQIEHLGWRAQLICPCRPEWIDIPNVYKIVTSTPRLQHPNLGSWSVAWANLWDTFKSRGEIDFFKIHQRTCQKQKETFSSSAPRVWRSLQSWFLLRSASPVCFPEKQNFKWIWFETSQDNRFCH